MGSRLSTEALSSTGTREPSGRMKLFSYGGATPVVSRLASAAVSAANDSGAVMSVQRSPVSSSARVRPMIASQASLSSR